MTGTDPTTRLDAVAEELVERDRVLRRAQLVARGRRDSARGHRALIRDLTIVLALSPYTRATDAPPGRLGRPIEPAPPPPVIPRQRSRPTLGAVAIEMERRRSADRKRYRDKHGTD